MNKAEILTEALPYMQKYYNKTVVVKFGGHAMTDEALKYAFASDIVLLKQVGINPIIIHGGGPQIGSMLERLKIAFSFEGGFRVTSPEVMEVVEMILSGKINKEIVGLIAANGGRAVGFSGRDGNLISAKKLILKDTSKDLGLAGIVEKIDTAVLEAVRDFIPVIAPVGIGKKGEPYNINADLAAGSIASALKAEKLLLLTDVKGVLDKDGNRIPFATLAQLDKLREEGVVTGGMIPKLQGVYDAINAGVARVNIIDGREPHSILLELFTDHGVGTEIVKQ
ncbi:MAG: acetylglutamate kinase [Deferribacteraceae bacterium]|jgi:acetylglutamate kinase|nr:acetylglutamate kinase [Deferribacteraceae bacterium]